MKRVTLFRVALAALLIALAAASQALVPVRATAAAAPVAKEVSTIPFNRLFSHSTGIHFYTIDENRKLEAVGAGWTSEGVAAHILKQQVPGTVPLYILAINYNFRGKAGDAVFGYTTSEEEKNNLLNTPNTSYLLGGYVNGDSKWRLDSSGIAGYIALTQLPGTVPLYRLYHPPAFGPDETERDNAIQMVNFLHFRRCLFNAYDNLYTTSEKEKASALTQHGYKFIRIEGYVWPQPSMVSTQPAAPKPAGPKIDASNPASVVNPDTDLLNRGCARTGVGSYKCPTIGAYEACERYRTNGKVKACSTSANEKVQAAMEKELFTLGCTRFLGRPDEFLCKTQKSLDLCEAYRKNGTLKKCLLTKQ